MPQPSFPASTVARLTTDESTARHLLLALAEICDGEAVAVSITDAGSHSQPAERWSLALHFRDPPDEAAVRSLIATATAGGDARQAAFAQALARNLSFETLAPTDWVRRSLEGLRPVEAGRFMVHGAHHRSLVRASITIEIDASLAFGTGHHGSTLGCLRALDHLVRRWHHGKRPRASVLDVGTGSGILAIAAAKALHRLVLASDIDARAVTIARDNARINGVAARIELVRAAGIGARRLIERAPYSLIFANILLEPLRVMATPLTKLLAPNGRVVLSGLLNSQASAALASYRARGLALEERIAIGGWTTLVLRRVLDRPSAPRPSAPWW